MPRATVFVTRKFPPSVGGMETLAADVWATVSAAGTGQDRLIAHGGANSAMPRWLPGAIVRLVRLVRTGRVQHVLVGDVLLYLVLRPVLLALRVPHAVMAMGKDVVWRQPVYQWTVRRVLPRAPQILAISRATADSVRAVGVSPQRVQVVRLGVEAPDSEITREQARQAVRDRFDLPAEEFAVLTLGRLVTRKGVAWFVDQVLPELPQTRYLVAGSGPEAERIAELATRRGVRDRLLLLGAVSSADRELLMRGADLFLQPNVAVPGDMEGFGLVAVEAAMRGSLVLAADLEGLRDAVLDGETGVLLPSGDVQAWVRAVQRAHSDPADNERRAAEYAARARELYARERMGAQLRSVLHLND